MKNLSNLGKILSKNEQKSIIGGKACNTAEECGEAPFTQLEYRPARCITGTCFW
jgi:hypothetical protein